MMGSLLAGAEIAAAQNAREQSEEVRYSSAYDDFVKQFKTLDFILFYYHPSCILIHEPI